MHAIAVVGVVLLVNVIDNDLLSYGFLPYIVIGINNLIDKKTQLEPIKSLP